jgi:hypothetical protein
MGLPHSELYSSPLEGENKVIARIRLHDGALPDASDGKEECLGQFFRHEKPSLQPMQEDDIRKLLVDGWGHSFNLAKRADVTLRDPAYPLLRFPGDILVWSSGPDGTKQLGQSNHRHLGAPLRCRHRLALRFQRRATPAGWGPRPCRGGRAARAVMGDLMRSLSRPVDGVALEKRSKLSALIRRAGIPIYGQPARAGSGGTGADGPGATGIAGRAPGRPALGVGMGRHRLAAEFLVSRSGEHSEAGVAGDSAVKEIRKGVR